MFAGLLPKICGFITLLVSSHFAECRENWQVTVRNGNKSHEIPILQWWGKW